MKTYSVTLPVSGVIHTEVEAESEDDAIEKALADPDITIDDIAEWEPCRNIVEGNVFYGHTNEASAEEV